MITSVSFVRMPFLIYLLLGCLCAVSVAANWSVVWNDTIAGEANFAAFDPSFPDLTVVYFQGGDYLCAVNVTTGEVLWSTNGTITYMVSAALRGGVLFIATSVVDDNKLAILYALNALNGQLKWTGPQFDYRSTIVAPQGTEFLIVTTYFAVYTVNSSSGNTIWEFTVPYFDGPPHCYGVFEGIVSVAFPYTLYGLDSKSGTSLWQVNVSGGYFTLTTPSTGIVTYQRGTMFYVDAIDVFTGQQTEWVALNMGRPNTTEGVVLNDVSSKMVVVLFCYPLSSFSALVFDSTSGTLVAMVPDIVPSQVTGLLGCLAGLCIYSTDYDRNLIAVNYITGSLAWNVTVPIEIYEFTSYFTYMRPSLIVAICRAYVATGVVMGIDPTNGKYWTGLIGDDHAKILQQRGGSQVLVVADKLLVLANV